MRHLLVLSLLLLFATAASGQTTGLLVMAHGGSDEWNAAVEEAVAPLADETFVAVAFGMANPETLQRAVDDLEAAGVDAIAVVRLFVSGESFLPQTEYAFGLRAEKPPGRFMHEPRLLDLNVPVSLSDKGLMDVTALGRVMADRAAALSANPKAESVLIIGHGPASDEENDRWLSRMDAMAETVRESAPYHHVRVATLREDWTGKRQVAEEELRAFVEAEAAQGRRALIVPFRLFGFGPYADVFEGLDYEADYTGFLPDPAITDWIATQYKALVDAARSADS